MSEKTTNTKIADVPRERVGSIRITDHDGIINKPDDVYELDFCRESVVFAENRGFKVEEVLTFPVTRISELFYYSFRKNHPRVARDKTDNLMKKWGGLSESVLERLVLLYNQAAMSNTFQSDEDAEKNGIVTVEM